MSRTYTERTAFLVNVLDRDGWETGRAVLVEAEYVVDIDAHYGADADGHRGEMRVEYELLAMAVEAHDANTLLAEEEAQVLASARATFEKRDHHWI